MDWSSFIMLGEYILYQFQRSYIGTIPCFLPCMVALFRLFLLACLRHFASPSTLLSNSSSEVNLSVTSLPLLLTIYTFSTTVSGTVPIFSAWSMSNCTTLVCIFKSLSAATMLLSLWSMLGVLMKLGARTTARLALSILLFSEWAATLLRKRMTYARVLTWIWGIVAVSSSVVYSRSCSLLICWHLMKVFRRRLVRSGSGSSRKNCLKRPATSARWESDGMALPPSMFRYERFGKVLNMKLLSMCLNFLSITTVQYQFNYMHAWKHIGNLGTWSPGGFDIWREFLPLK